MNPCRRQALREGVNQLPEVQKRRLQMYFFDGLTYEEIAVREGCSYQAVQKFHSGSSEKNPEISEIEG